VWEALTAIGSILSSIVIAVRASVAARKSDFTLLAVPPHVGPQM